jgi:hypothetical protein
MGWNQALPVLPDWIFVSKNVKQVPKHQTYTKVLEYPAVPLRKLASKVLFIHFFIIKQL